MPHGSITLQSQKSVTAYLKNKQLLPFESYSDMPYQFQLKCSSSSVLGVCTAENEVRTALQREQNSGSPVTIGNCWSSSASVTANTLASALLTRIWGFFVWAFASVAIVFCSCSELLVFSWLLPGPEVSAALLVGPRLRRLMLNFLFSFCRAPFTPPFPCVKISNNWDGVPTQTRY